MILNIYGFDNTKFNYEIDFEKVKYLIVSVISGDEIVDVYFNTGEKSTFDPMFSKRICDSFDGTYLVEKDAIKLWNDFPVSEDDMKNKTISYLRMPLID